MAAALAMSTGAAKATETSPKPASPQPVVTPLSSLNSAGPAKRSKASKRSQGQRREAAKDADGSTAPNRFEAETVIKSRYTLDGKPLEVDPD